MIRTKSSWQFPHSLSCRALPILLPGLLVLLTSLLLLLPQPAAADGSAPLLVPPIKGCYDIVSYGVGLWGDGAGIVTVTSPGPVGGAYTEWVGVEDTTPAGDGTSILIINGVPIMGTLAAGVAGRATRLGPDWWVW